MPARVSVVIPTYQRRELVRRAVETVLGQTVQQFELLVVDDGSTDGTGEALTGLDPRLRYVWQENHGPSAARNAALRRSSAPVVAFLDSDNRWLPDHLEVVLGALGRHPAAVLASTCPRFLPQGNESVAQARLSDFLPAALFGNSVGFLSCLAARREALEAVGGFDESMWVAEDTDLLARLALVGPFVLIRRGTLLHQRTEGSLSRRPGGGADYLDALSQSAARIAERAEAASEGRAAAAGRPARAAAVYLEAFKALLAGDVDGGRRQLREACELYPELSRDPHLALGRIVQVTGFRPGGSLLATLAHSWPDPRARTPLTLRWLTVEAELRAGRWRAAARELVARPPLVLRPDIVLRVLPDWRLARTRRRLEQAG